MHGASPVSWFDEMQNSLPSILIQMQQFFGWPRDSAERLPGAPLRDPDCRLPARCDAGDQPRFDPDGSFPAEACRSCKLIWLGGAFLASCGDEAEPLAAVTALDDLIARMFHLDEPEIAYWLSGVRYFVDMGGEPHHC